MIRDITIGQYYQTDSVIHRLDPRVKLMGTLIFVISLFLGSNVWMYRLEKRRGMKMAIMLRCFSFYWVACIVLMNSEND